MLLPSCLSFLSFLFLFFFLEGGYEWRIAMACGFLTIPPAFFFFLIYSSLDLFLF